VVTGTAPGCAPGRYLNKRSPAAMVAAYKGLSRPERDFRSVTAPVGQ
jgi:hypothetical protein